MKEGKGRERGKATKGKGVKGNSKGKGKGKAGKATPKFGADAADEFAA